MSSASGTWHLPAVGLAFVAATAAMKSLATTFLSAAPLGVPRQDSVPATALRGSTAGPAQREAGARPAAAALAAAAVSSVAVGAALQRRRVTAVARRATAEEWNSRVRRIEGNRAVFTVTIPKPLGLVPRDFPTRPGVGVASIKPDGNAAALNKRVIIDEEPGMWVLEGDEVVEVDGVNVEGKSLEFVGPLVKDSPNDAVTLKLCRNTAAGPVKVVFLPSGKSITMKRGAQLVSAQETCEVDVAYSCREGWCKSCWHADPIFDGIYKACTNTVPETWDNVLPFVLMNNAETKRRKKAKAAKELAEQQAAKERA